MRTQVAKEDISLKSVRHDLNIMTPVALGLGCSKYRHKLAALLHQLRLEVGGDSRRLQRYCYSVVSICTDQGVEASLAFAPNVDLVHHLKAESAALAADLTAAAEGDCLLPLQICDDIQTAPETTTALPEGQALATSSSNSNEVRMATMLAGRLFPNSMFIPGTKHLFDNVIHDIWDAMKGKSQCLDFLRGFEYILKPTMRDKLVHLFFDKGTVLDCLMKQRLKTWSVSLKSLRWHAVIEFVKHLKPLQEGFQSRWCLKQFVSALPKERHDELADGRGPAGASTYRLVDRAIRSDYFWSYISMLLEVSASADGLSRWVETCFYHGSKCDEKSCCYKSCKGPELACGIHLYVLRAHQASSNLRVAQLAPKLTAQEMMDLVSDWHIAHSRLSLELQFKLHYWSLLPWKLCGLAANAIGVARVIARECQLMWSRMSPQQQQHSHPMTRRFLDPSWEGPSVWDDC